jgi:hypothetical protein
MDAILPRLLSPEAPALVVAVQPAVAEAVCRPSAVNLICSAASQFHRQDYAAMGRTVANARRRLGTMPADLRIQADIVLTIFEVAVARVEGRVPDLVQRSVRAVRLLDHAAPTDLTAAPQYRVLVLNNLGVGHLWNGRPREARSCLLAAAGDAERLSFEMPYLDALAHLALIDAVRGGLDAASGRAQHAVGLAERRAGASEPQIVAAYLSLALALQLVTDEEVGGRDGTLHQLRQGVNGTFVVIGEHSRLNIVADSKGLLQARLRASGRSGHGAYPWLGDNALLMLVDTVKRLMDQYPVATEEVWRTTVNLAKVDSPNHAFNQIPARAEAWLDIRFPANDTDLNSKTPPEIIGYLQTFCEPGVTVAIDHLDPPHHADHDRPEIQQLRRAAQGQG